MEKQDNLISSILDMQNSDPYVESDPYSISSIDSESSGNGFLDTIKNMSIITWILIILILAFLVFNIYIYLAKGTQDITNFFNSIKEKLFGKTDNTNKKNNISNEEDDVVPQNSDTKLPNENIKDTIPQADLLSNNELHHAVNASDKTHNNNQDYEAQEASSTVNSIGKPGWCYIGQDRGYRTCSQVGVSDTCMSGDIFPTHEVCVNPNLRV